jgi:transposase
MMKERKQFTKEFKEGAVRLVTEQGRTISDAAQGLGISPWTMSRWVKAARSEGADAFRGYGQRTPLEQENFELRQKVKQLEEERAILKKCMAPPPGSSAERIMTAQGWTDATNVSGFC